MNSKQQSCTSTIKALLRCTRAGSTPVCWAAEESVDSSGLTSAEVFFTGHEYVPVTLLFMYLHTVRCQRDDVGIKLIELGEKVTENIYKISLYEDEGI